MRISSIFPLPAIICMALFAPLAMAEDISVPDKEHRLGMSYEEYAKYREKMRMQMENRKPVDLKPKPAPANIPSDQMEKPQRDSAYGQGYHSRNQPADRPNVDAGSRPDRPRAERFNRGDMGRR